MSIPADSKKCSRCGQVKLLTAFGRDASARDLLKPACSECHRAWDKTYCSDPTNAAVRRARSRQWLRDHKEQKAKYSLLYAAANKERIADRQRAYRAAKRAAKRELVEA